MTRRFAAVLGLLLLLPFAVAATSPPPAVPVEGVDYEAIDNPGPYQPVKAGEIEVVEIFAYGCHHCADFAPRIDAWKRKQAVDVRVTYLPLPNGGSDPLARAYFAAESAGVLGKTHDAMFRAIHNEHTLPKNPTFDEIAAFHAQLGLDATRLKASMESAEGIDGK